jgi:hypothetical protein
MADQKPKKLSAGKRIAGFLFLGMVMIVSFTVSFLIVRSFAGPSQPEEVVHDAPGIAGLAILMFIGGIFCFCSGVLLYAVILLTQCFTFDFQKPFWNAFKKKLYVMHIIVTLLFDLGIAAFVSMIVTPLMIVLGLPEPVSFFVPVLATLILMQFLFTLISIWQPLEKSTVQKRMAAFGISQADISRGIPMGISDPAKSSFKKLTMVEEDVGMLWIGNDEILYRGDADSFRFGREQLIEIERSVDAGSMSAYGGNVHIILRFQTADETERRVRLHVEGCWTLRQTAKASDSLAETLLRWQKGTLSDEF